MERKWVQEDRRAPHRSLTAQISVEETCILWLLLNASKYESTNQEGFPKEKFQRGKGHVGKQFPEYRVQDADFTWTSPVTVNSFPLFLGSKLLSAKPGQARHKLHSQNNPCCETEMRANYYEIMRYPSIRFSIFIFWIAKKNKKNKTHFYPWFSHFSQTQIHFLAHC